MAYINPFIKVNAGGIPRLEARNVPEYDSNYDVTYDFLPHRFLNYPYSGLIIFKLPSITQPPDEGSVFFTSGGQNKTQVFNGSGIGVKSNNGTLALGGVFIGWYSDNKLLILNI